MENAGTTTFYEQSFARLALRTASKESSSLRSEVSLSLCSRGKASDGDFPPIWIVQPVQTKVIVVAHPIRYCVFADDNDVTTKAEASFAMAHTKTVRRRIDPD